MQGYIIDIKNVRDDDLIVSILSSNYVYTAYRFYGARHSVLNIGFKIDFELENSFKSQMPRLKDVLQLNFSWILDKTKLYCWQRFIKLLFLHLKDVEKLDAFYFESLEKIVRKIVKQNPKRAIIEEYVKILKYEGRLHDEFICFLCEKKIENNISLVRSFLPTHSVCSYSKTFTFSHIEELFNNNSLILFEDDDIEYLWDILMQGL